MAGIKSGRVDNGTADKYSPEGIKARAKDLVNSRGFFGSARDEDMDSQIKVLRASRNQDTVEKDKVVTKVPDSQAPMTDRVRYRHINPDTGEEETK